MGKAESPKPSRIGSLPGLVACLRCFFLRVSGHVRAGGTSREARGTSTEKREKELENEDHRGLCAYICGASGDDHLDKSGERCCASETDARVSASRVSSEAGRRDAACYGVGKNCTADSGHPKVKQRTSEEESSITGALIACACLPHNKCLFSFLPPGLQ